MFRSQKIAPAEGMAVKHYFRRKKSLAASNSRRGEDGFSMVETLVALLVLSAIAGIVFELLRAQFELSQRVERKAYEILSSTLERERLNMIVERLVPGWPDDEASRFAGDDRGFSGLTSAGFRSTAPGIVSFSLNIVEPEGTLTYRGEDADLNLARLGTSAVFSYLDESGNWQPRWPPAQQPEIGPSPTPQYKTPLPLPAAIRIQLLDGSDLDWLARVGWRSPRLMRDQDVFGMDMDQ